MNPTSINYPTPPTEYQEDYEGGYTTVGRKWGAVILIVHSEEWKDGVYIFNRLRNNKRFIDYIICKNQDHAVKHICNMLRIRWLDFDLLDTIRKQHIQMFENGMPNLCLVFDDDTSSQLVGEFNGLCYINEKDFITGETHRYERCPLEVIHHG